MSAVRPTTEVLEAAVQMADRARADREHILECYDDAVEAALLAARIEHQYLVRARRRLEAYDQDSEQMMAENAGRADSLRARLNHIRTGQVADPGPPAVDSIERELRQLEYEHEHLVPLRIRRRAPFLRRVRVASYRAAVAGDRAWRLSQERLADLEKLIKAGENAREMLAAAPAAVAAAPADVGGACVHRDHAHA